jgi:putative transposase
MTEVLPLLYLYGLSTNDFGLALVQFLGSGAGLSATTITRLTAQWQEEAKTCQESDLSSTDCVYLWVDGIHLKVRIEQEKLCLPAGNDRGPVRRPQGTRRAHRRLSGVHRVVGGSAAGLPPARGDRPVLAVGDGALGSGRHCARCSRPRASSAAGSPSKANVLAALPKSAHPGAMSAR